MHAIAFRRLARTDFPLMRHWLETPHVKRWWAHETTPQALEADFGPTIDGLDPADMFVAHWQGRPVGFIQRYRYADSPEYLEEMRQLVDTPGQAQGIDYFIGEPHALRQGVGAAMIRACTASTWDDHPDAPCIVVAVHAENTASWKVLERAGYRRVASGEMVPDNPIDSRDHLVYAAWRPARPG